MTISASSPRLSGHSLIAGTAVPGRAGAITGFNPATGGPLEPAYSLLDNEQVGAATAAAAAAFESFRALAPEPHAALLDDIAAAIEADGESIITRAMAETGLTRARLTGELARTTGQLRLFGSVVRKGDHRGVRIDPAQPERSPMPRVDIRQRKVPLGPVVVFGASNFPLAFSTAGGDTASALAAGCPVIVKAHNAHPGTSELVGRAIASAVSRAGLHPGVFSLVYGPGNAIGEALVADPRVQAVGFTGSRQGGLALVAAAAARPVPIPVYAEMSSVNPTFILPGALKGDLAALATGYVGSLTGSSGQLCTAPGLVFVPRGARGDEFVRAIGSAISANEGQTMLTSGIAAAWKTGVDALESQAGVELVARGSAGTTQNAPAPVVFEADTGAFMSNGVLQEEIFGAAGLFIRYGDNKELTAAASRLEGQLTATMHLTDEDLPQARGLVEELETKVGRILVNGWPTGVEVGHAMVHGGPFPATSAPATTSVGTRAIERFLRPVAYQNFPEGLLPEPLRDGNPWSLNRLIDGQLTLGEHVE